MSSRDKRQQPARRPVRTEPQAPTTSPLATVQRKAGNTGLAALRSQLRQGGEPPPPAWLRDEATDEAPVQARGDLAGADIHEAAARGVAGGGGALPHLDAIQRSFGHHDVSGVRAHVGGKTADAAQAIGARAYATGDDVAFAETPDLHLAAHEAAHVVQQRGGVQLSGGVGQAGDAYERHADAVADRVVRGESAESLLDQMAQHRGASGGRGVQRKMDVGAVQRNEQEDDAACETADGRAAMCDTVSDQMDHGPVRPSWVPADVWEQFLAAGDGIHRYPNRSPVQTDIILVRRDGIVDGYTEGQTNPDILFEHLEIEPPSLLRRLLGAERPEQSRVRWLARANRGYNEFMAREVEGGRSPTSAFNAYPQAVYNAYIMAFAGVTSRGRR